MKQIIYILFMFFAFIACDDTKVGYRKWMRSVMILNDDRSKNPDEEEERTGLNGNTLGCLRQYKDIGNLPDSL
ncbi:MAG: hypothetical protein ACLU4N_05185 [Butyricimonas faecihominis]